MAKQRTHPGQQNNTITTGTNAGSSGGTTNFINLGGIKMAWGITNSITIAGNGAAGYNITFPIAYISPPSITAIPFGSGSYNDWITVTVQTISSTSTALAAHNFGAGTSGSEQIMWTATGV